MVTLREDGFQKVAAGVTTVEEVLRVTEGDDLTIVDCRLSIDDRGQQFITCDDVRASS